jgi:hypothetical protein
MIWSSGLLPPTSGKKNVLKYGIHLDEELPAGLENWRNTFPIAHSCPDFSNNKKQLQPLH